MSSIPGPILLFRIDAPGLSAAVQPAMDQVRNSARATTQAIASDWQRMSAQIRASLVQEVSSVKDIGAARQRLVAVLDRELTLLRSKDSLTTKELSNLKAVTLERERQVDAMKRGAAIGITGGTASALGYGANQVSAQTTLGIERIVDSLVNRYFGGAAGAMTRTVRDISYYSNQASGGTGKSGGLFGLSGTALGALGTVGAIAGIGTALGVVAVKGGNLAIELTKLSEKTGLTTEEVIKLRSASSALDVDFDRVTIGFKKFSSELTLASTADLPNASKSAKEAAALFKALGVNVKLAAQDPFAAMQQLAKTLSALPDGFVKTNAASVLFGRGGLELVPVFDKMDSALSSTAKSSADLAKAMGKDGAADSAEKLRAQMVNFKNETDALEVSLSQRLLPAMVSTINWINGHLSLIGNIAKGSYAVSTLGGSLLLEEGYKGIASLFGSKSGSSAGSLDAMGYMKSLPEVPKNMDDIAKAAAKVGDASEKAAKGANKAAKALEETYVRFARIANSAHPGQTQQQKVDEEMRRLIGPSLGINPAATLGPPSLTGVGIGTLPHAPTIPNQAGPSDILAQLQKVNDEYLKETQSETDKVKAEYDAQLDYWKFIQKQYPAYAQQAAEAITKIQEEQSKKLSDIQDQQMEQYKRAAGSLFDDLVSGNTKRFSESLLKTVEEIALKPFKDAFANYLGGIFSRLNSTVNGKPGTSGPLGSLGGILGGVFGPNSPGGTPGWWPGNIGINGRTGTGSPAGGGQIGVATQTMYVTANVVNLSGPIGPGGSGNGVGLPGASNFFGDPSSFFGNNNPFSGVGPLASFGNSGGSLSSRLGGLLGKAAPFLAGAMLLGSGIGSGNGASMSLGAAGLATSVSGKLASSSLADKLGSGFGGAGLIGAGISEGGFGGAISDIAGGVELGSVIPGVGSLVGGIIGGIAGVVRGIFGSRSWAQNVQRAMNRQQYNRPPSETFDFASNGSIASTLSTGFAQSGNTFSQFGLPSNTPFWANAITGYMNPRQIRQFQSEQAGLDSSQPFLGFPSTNPFVGQGPLGYKSGTAPSVSVNLNLPGLMDPTMAAAVFTAHAQTIAQLVGRQVYQTSSGFGRNVRSAVALP